MKNHPTRHICRWLVWGSAAMLLFLAACAGRTQPTPTAAPTAAPSPTATRVSSPTPEPTTTPVPAEPTRQPAGQSGKRTYVLPTKGAEDAPVTIIEFSDYL